MAGSKIDNFGTSDPNLTAIMDSLQAFRNGHFALSLTEIDSSTVPEISAGSIIDINGTLIYFNDDESISGSPSDGIVYVKLIYSSGVVSAEFTNDDPEFDSSKNGWYGTSTSSGHRYVAKMIKSSSSYTGKTYLDSANIPYIYEIQSDDWSGTWNGGATKTITLTYSSDVQSIVAFNFNAVANGTSSVISVDSISITNNTVVITATSRYVNNFLGYYSVSCTAAL